MPQTVIGRNSAETGVQQLRDCRARARAFTHISSSLVLTWQHPAESGAWRVQEAPHVPPLVPVHGEDAWPTLAPSNGVSFFPECCRNVSGFPAAFGAPGSRGDPAESEDAAAACAARAHRWAAPDEVLLPPRLQGRLSAQRDGCLWVSSRVTRSLPSLAAGALRGQSWGGSSRRPASTLRWPWP